MSTDSSKRVQLPNAHLPLLQNDFLFHLDFDINSPDILAQFKEVKFVCIGGTAGRMRQLALHFKEEIGHKVPDGEEFDYTFTNERYSAFKVGPVLCINHGIGTPSLSVMLHETFKLLHKAECSDVTLIRVGTCGGIGISHGTVVISTGSLTAGLEPYYHTSSIGKPLKLPTGADLDLVKDLQNCQREDDGFEVVTGKTYCAEDFYQGQGRLDGSFCDYTKEDREDFLTTLHNNGVRNIEMESAGVLALAKKAGIRAAVVSVTLMDRLKTELPTVSNEELTRFQDHPIKLVSRYIKQKLGK